MEWTDDKWRGRGVIRGRDGGRNGGTIASKPIRFGPISGGISGGISKANITSPTDV